MISSFTAQLRHKKLTIFGGTSNNHISVQISSLTIPPAESTAVIEQADSENGQIGIASSDPDTPTQYIDIVGPEQFLGTTAPDFSLSSLDGSVYHLNDYMDNMSCLLRHLVTGMCVRGLGHEHRSAKIQREGVMVFGIASRTQQCGD